VFPHEDAEPIEGNASGPAEQRSGASRRDLFKNAAGVVLAAAGAGFAGVLGDRWDAAAQIPLPRPVCRISYLDRKQYLHNMEIHAQ
jgi:hypothetical protein